MDDLIFHSSSETFSLLFETSFNLFANYKYVVFLRNGKKHRRQTTWLVFLVSNQLRQFDVLSATDIIQFVPFGKSDEFGKQPCFLPHF